MTSYALKTLYQFFCSKCSLGAKSIYSPPLASDGDTFWQLRFEPTNPYNGEYCSLYLEAIPGKCEIQNTTADWPARKKILPRIFIRKANNEQTDIVTKAVKASFNAEGYSWGWANFCLKSDLPETFCFGVEFDKSSLIDQGFFGPLTAPTKPKLLEAWMKQFNNPKTSDVKFSFGEEGYLFASSLILAAQSEYFETMFHETLNDSTSDNSPECKKFDHKRQDSTSSSDTAVNEPQHEKGDTESGLEEIPWASSDTESVTTLHIRQAKVYDYEIEITDVSRELFGQMLMYLYTGEIFFLDDVPSKPCRNAFDLYILADQYSLEELKKDAQNHIVASLTINNAAEIFFETAWKWPALKSEVSKFIVANFVDICNSDGYNKILAKNHLHSSFHELNTEILLALFRKEIPKKIIKDKTEKALTSVRNPKLD
ncbi:hypothetical protein G9A89_005010 [Geosiphon pyriformis]|nr:hypothetical protein G9A89_005010 [Geosiphon pyriformis]